MDMAKERAPDVFGWQVEERSRVQNQSKGKQQSKEPKGRTAPARMRNGGDGSKRYAEVER